MGLFSQDYSGTIVWEAIKNIGGPALSYRAKVPGGWLFSIREQIGNNPGAGITFIPDPEHNWDGDSL